MRATIATALLAFAILLPACDSSETGDVETRAIEDFEDGMALDSDDGAFRVTLWSDSGDLVVGRNDLIVRIGFHDPNDASAPGMGVPNARIEVDAWMPAADTAMQSEPDVTYLGDGQYRIENVVLGQDGVWNFDFDMAVGEHMRETLSLAFEIAE